ncbi:MAG: hypothetical protein ACLQO1_25810 [Steroidobacteraceae bacterium]
MNKSTASFIGVAFLSPAIPFTVTPVVLNADIGAVDCHVNERKDCAPHQTHDPKDEAPSDGAPRVHTGSGVLSAGDSSMRAALASVASVTATLTTASG